MNRHTFVLQVYPDGGSVLENLDTRERVRISDAAAIGPQIERWVADLPESRSEGVAQSGTEDRSRHSS